MSHKFGELCFHCYSVPCLFVLISPSLFLFHLVSSYIQVFKALIFVIVFNFVIRTDSLCDINSLKLTEALA